MQPHAERRIIAAWGKLSPVGKLTALVVVLVRAGLLPALIVGVGGYAAFSLPPLVTVGGVLVLWLAIRATTPRKRAARAR